MFSLVKAYHDKKHPGDKTVKVYRSIKLREQRYNHGGFEVWLIGTEKANQYEYIAQVYIQAAYSSRFSWSKTTYLVIGEANPTLIKYFDSDLNWQ